MNAFELIQPDTLEEALSLLNTDDPLVRPLAGGTALMLMMKSKLYAPERLVSLQRLKPSLDKVEVDAAGNLHLGPLVSLRELELSPVVARFNPVIPKALRTLSNVRVRNVATLGGHLAHGDPHMDLPPILLALDAHVRLSSTAGQRDIPLGEFLTGYYSTALAPGELITEVVVPSLPKGMRGTYYKFTALSADDWPMAGVATFVRLEDGQIADARVAVSAATERPVRLHEVESFLRGQRPTDEVLQHAGELAGAQIHPLADIRGSYGYKREIVKVCVRRSLQQVSQGDHNGDGGVTQ
ncbi:MAG: xanthine dehydrogenase family protein subunit M [Alicyclobacillus macrosporangiidus]|uniref:FAD binding domain-containing protein n=1 Tax=Alicyclobacillus macrosporangiidus TaxID=392015 RepID=UPI0026F0CC01|nr:xanthine dehydrogenase family protein subunit M [Alicyclobacillus macrosporangiidus]MCL6599759.1 xanthine dehydrogenase family protein subunit M [Alicyclobacillus macrosporangiidus]